MAKAQNLKVDGHDITVSDKGYISLTDIANAFNPEGNLIENWLRKKDTIEFLGVWESLNNSEGFNSLDFEGIRNEAGSNRFTLSVKRWVQATNAIGIESRTGRYGSGTFAHKDIATEFSSYISPVFRLYLIKEFDRLKSAETNNHTLEWNLKRVMSKANYHIHTDAVQKHRVPFEKIPFGKEGIIYADEAEILNYAVFGITSKKWREENPQLHLQGQNLRDYASINELLVLANMEGLNAVMLASHMPKEERIKELRNIAQNQLTSLNSINIEKSYKRTVEGTFINQIEQPAKGAQKAADEPKPNTLSDFNQKLNQALNYNPKDKDMEKPSE